MFDGIDQTVHRVFSSSTAGLLALAAVVAVWEVSGIIRASIGALDQIEMFIFLATYFYVAAIVLLVAMELDELVRLDMQRPRNKQELLPLVAGVIRGT